MFTPIPFTNPSLPPCTRALCLSVRARLPAQPRSRPLPAALLLRKAFSTPVHFQKAARAFALKTSSLLESRNPVPRAVPISTDHGLSLSALYRGACPRPHCWSFAPPATTPTPRVGFTRPPPAQPRSAERQGCRRALDARGSGVRAQLTLLRDPHGAVCNRKVYSVKMPAGAGSSRGKNVGGQGPSVQPYNPRCALASEALSRTVPPELRRRRRSGGKSSFQVSQASTRQASLQKGQRTVKKLCFRRRGRRLLRRGKGRPVRRAAGSNLLRPGRPPAGQLRVSRT